MKKRVLVTFLAMAVVAACAITGCGKRTSKTESTKKTTVEETAKTETNESIKSSTTENAVDNTANDTTVNPSVDEASSDTKSVAEASSEETSKAEPTREVKIYTYNDGKHGPYEIPSFDKDNVYAKKLHDAYGTYVYPGAYIIKEDKGWIWYFEPETDDGSYLYVGSVDDPEYLQGEERDNFMKEIDKNLGIFINKCESGEIKPVDLDGDGQISYPEAYICSFYVMYPEQKKHYKGIVTFLDYNKILW